MSAAPSTTRRPSATSTRANLPTVVVFPVPLTPTTSNTEGWPACGSARIERSMPGCSSLIRTSRNTARASASVRTLPLARRLRSCDTTDAVAAGPRSATSRVSSTSCQESSSRSPPPISPNRPRPRAFCDLASRPRSRSNRPSGGAMASASGTSGAWGSGSNSGRCTSAIVRLGASRGTVASSPTAGSPLVSIRSAGWVVGV
ncbi:Uncharacterised protein [Mycobacterium tuberculosis]|uniref:Uncharacterized protein n=1 Tax=Mycobacterium tuberculosis TaxID=1773 RepID=A0A0U0SBC1_MYCTX|nr:Uncharacterised protein [Mycobacterium tuberculosis]CFS18197.1 Uncharacterised protein [Mycobacterium tuberculosis]CFS58441.1 Uncharacterised protein [Mycobacterium tuberculosis]CKQ11882.1 Uncharacterised protein [Mycobacterium tuberculosis]CKR27355.1 Uncharacterised protein [Mycobacterium tuberculosis]